jgi:hypothetical protein
MSLFIVVMMLGSVMGFVLTSGTASTTTRYNGHKVQLVSNGYLVDYEKERLQFYYAPQDLEFLDVDTEILNSFKASPLAIISFDPSIQDVGVLDYARLTLFDYFSRVGKQVVFGVSEDTVLYDTFPVLNCANATSGIPVLIYEDANVSQVRYEPNCMIISSAEATHRIRMTELLSYYVLGIINER